MRRLVSVVLGLALACITPALADLSAGNGELGFDLGYGKFDSNVSDEGAARFNFRGGYCFTKLFQLEGEGLGMGNNDSSFPERTVGLGVNFVNAVFNFHPANREIVPYVLLGLGYATLSVDLDPGPDEDDSAVAWQIAGGSRFFFGAKHRVAVRVEFSVIRESTFNEASNHFGLTGGFTWRLGGQK